MEKGGESGERIVRICGRGNATLALVESGESGACVCVRARALLPAADHTSHFYSRVSDQRGAVICGRSFIGRARARELGALLHAVWSWLLYIRTHTSCAIMYVG